ncbi:L-arabinose isomerase [Commensalibacter sp. Nvir]|uniref:L-arabinose isomerase n=1 Tax=Commensalibacter sp. Nvir TaxID=3069817 RepID=UPI002D2B0364|nr:L-arabinose isomerase [Commensalibacter sp. Nvir]
MTVFNEFEVWFFAGSQHLYGPKTLQQVEENAKEIASYFNQEANLPVKIVYKPTVTRPDEITSLCREANYNPKCIGLITWLHTFSPSKMWIEGLRILDKPLLQLHTQHNQTIPWNDIDMDFMNLNQTAHGGREFGFICARMKIPTSVATGYWKEQSLHKQISKWMRVSAAITAEQSMKVVRFGDNMREVAVTEGNKVFAQMQFGYSVNTHPVSELVDVVNAIAQSDVDNLVEEYEACYRFSEATQRNGSKRQNVIEAARIELGIKKFLQQGNFSAFTTTFEDLHGLKQLPGIAAQRLMQQGYGFGGEGDWKTSAFLRTIKFMAKGMERGTSFMEDYTYDFSASQELVMGAHMLEVCPSIAENKPLLDAQYLGIGGKEDPVRLIFQAKPGPSINASLIDMGNRFRLVTNTLETVEQPHALPKLPVACAIWKPLPNFRTSIEAWVASGAAHHSVYTQALDMEYFRLYAKLRNIELLVIDEDTKIEQFQKEIQWNDILYSK